MNPMFVDHVCGLLSQCQTLYSPYSTHQQYWRSRLVVTFVICDVPLVDDRVSGQIDFLCKLVQKILILGTCS